MIDLEKARAELLLEVEKINQRYELSKTITDSYYEPGLMENLDQYHGEYDFEGKTIHISTMVKGLRFDERTLRLDALSLGDSLCIVREKSNQFNSNNFAVTNIRGESLGSLPKELCNALAPLYDLGYAIIENAKVSYLEKLDERSRYACQGVLFLRFTVRLLL